MVELLDENFDPSYVASELKRVGAVSVSLVPENLRLNMLGAFQGNKLVSSGMDYIYSGSVNLGKSGDIFTSVGLELDQLINQLEPHSKPFLRLPYSMAALLDFHPGSYLDVHVDYSFGFELTPVSVSILLEGGSNFFTYPNAIVAGDSINPEFDPHSVTQQDRHEIKSKPGDVIFFRRNFAGLKQIPHEIFAVDIRRKTAVYA